MPSSPSDGTVVLVGVVSEGEGVGKVTDGVGVGIEVVGGAVGEGMSVITDIMVHHTNLYPVFMVKKAP